MSVVNLYALKVGVVVLHALKNENGEQWFADQVDQLAIEYLIALAMQRKQQHQCIIYCMRCW